MTTPIRQVKLSTGHILSVYDTGRMYQNSKARLGYTFTAPDFSTLFEGEDFGASPMHGIDSDSTLLALLSFLTLKPGDTDADYFAGYTEAQRAWSESSECEMLAADLSIAEEQAHGGCACIVWENLDGWECGEDIRGNVVNTQVLDHGEDGSQYFPGCGVANTHFQHVVTGVGDTGAEAFDDALEQMASGEPEARMSKLQEAQAREYLSDPNKSASDSLDHTECGEDHEGDDWNHYVSIRYNVREGA